MPRIAHLTAEVGDLSEWDAVNTTGTINPGATNAAAMGGTRWGWSIPISGTDTAIFRKVIIWTTRTIRCRFAFDPNSVSLADAVTRVIASVWNATDGNVAQVFFQDSGGFSIALNYQQDGGGGTNTTFVSLSDAVHTIEFEIKRASSATASDGHVKFWVDDVLEDTDTGLDIWDLGRPTEVRLEWATNNNAGDSGTLYFDELFVNNDGNPIGLVWLPTVMAKESFDGGLSHLSLQSLGGGRISAETAAALAGSKRGVEFDAGAAGPFVGEDFVHFWNTDVLRFRIHLNANNVSLADTNARGVFRTWSNGTTSLDGIEIKDDSGYQLRAFLTGDTVGVTTDWYSITADGDHVVEVEITRASSAVAADGTLKLWIDEVLQETVGSIDLFDQLRADRWLIEWAGGNAGDSGSVYIDEIEVRDKSRLIGSAVKAERGYVAVTMDGLAYDYIDGTGSRQDNLGSSPSTYSFQSYERPPDDDPDVVFTITWQDANGVVNRTETFFAGKITQIKQETLEPARVSIWTITVADQRHELARKLLNGTLGPGNRADQVVSWALGASGLTAAGWTLQADQGEVVDGKIFNDAPMNEVVDYAANQGGMMVWSTYDKVLHMRNPDTLQSPHEIDRESPGHWHSHDFAWDRGAIINWIKGTGTGNFKARIAQDAASQAQYHLRESALSYSVDQATLVQNAINRILAARKDPLITGSIDSDYDRLQIGENTLVIDLDRGLRDVPVRIAGLSWTEEAPGEWRTTVRYTNDEILASIRFRGESVPPP